MQLLSNGRIMFDNIYDLTYNLLMAIGLSINQAGYVYDQDSRTVIQFHGLNIKASVDPRIPCYAGQGEVTFDILTNIRLVTTLLGYALEKETHVNPSFSCLSHYIDDDPDGSKRTSMVLKMADYSTRPTLFYNNKCLKFIHAIFLIYDEMDVDLTNFDMEV